MQRALQVHRRVKVHDVWYTFARKLSPEDFAPQEADPVEEEEAPLDQLEEMQLLDMSIADIAERLRGRMLVRLFSSAV